jgi:hypothetical protein
MAHPFASQPLQPKLDVQLLLVPSRHLGDGSGGTEALAIREPRAAEWLQLRFGGQVPG